MDFELLLEAERRGILPPDKASLLAEARRRGLVPAGSGPAAPAQPGIGQRIWENVVGDNDPNTQNFGEKVGTWLNKAGESATFGLVGDEASGALAGMIPGGMNYEQRRDYERQQERLLEQTNPGAALTADVGGAIAGALTPAGAIGTLGRGAGLLPRIGASAAAGAGMGATSGFMEGEGVNDRLGQAQTGAILGAGVGAVVPAIGAGVQRFADGRAASRAIREAGANAPTTEQLRAQGQNLYRQIDDAGLQVRPDRVRGAMGEIVEALRNEGAAYTGADKVLPASRAIMEAVGDVGQGNTVPMRELDMLRRYLGAAAGRDLTNRADTRAATNALGQLDDFVAKLGPDDVDAGDLETVQTLLPKAREIWARMSRSQLLDDAMENAADYRTGEASGLRAQFQRIVRSPTLSRGFSKTEIALMRRVINGSLPEQVLNYLGSGLGIMAQGTLGGVMGNIPGAIAGLATGAASRRASEGVVRRNAEMVRNVIANGGIANLPVASDSARRITEALMRRTAAAGAQ